VMLPPDKDLASRKMIVRVRRAWMWLESGGA
jgi:hypothetical protein